MRERAHQEGSELQTINATLALDPTKIIDCVYTHKLNREVSKRRTSLPKTETEMLYCLVEAVEKIY